MRHPRTLARAAAITLFCIVTAFAETVVPITSEPSHHLAISNEYVRAFKVEVAPKAETLYHQHDYDYVYVTIGDAELTNTRLNAAAAPLKLKDGETRFSKAPLTHKVGNNLDVPFRNVTIELLKGIGTPICGVAGGEKSCGPGWKLSAASGGHSEPLLDSQKLAVSTVYLDPGSTTPANFAGEGPLLVVPITKAKMKIAGNTQDEEREPGDTIWIPSGANRLISNRSATPAKLVVLEFKAI